MAAPRVLIVDRDARVRELAAYFLRAAEYETDEAPDGAVALEMIHTRSYALVIIEILLPRLDGLSVCKRLKADPAQRATLVLVHSILAAQVRSTEAGADGFIMKPLAQERLLAAVGGLLGRKAK